jgi:phospholipase/carboxylesterase
VLTAIDAVRVMYPVDSEQIYVTGHSEGGVLAYGLAINNPGIIRGLIVVGARLREEDAAAEALVGAAGKLQALICHSPEDRAMAFESAKSAHKSLKAAGIKSELVSYLGGHGITAELVGTIARWIAHPDRLKASQLR